MWSPLDDIGHKRPHRTRDTTGIRELIDERGPPHTRTHSHIHTHTQSAKKMHSHHTERHLRRDATRNKQTTPVSRSFCRASPAMPSRAVGTPTAQVSGLILLFTALSTRAVTVFEPPGTPGRLPDVLPSSIDNVVVDYDPTAESTDAAATAAVQTLEPSHHSKSSAVEHHQPRERRLPRINVTALIIASTLPRFERAAQEVRKSDIRSTVWIPAVFLNETNYSMCGGGGNGLRHAMRNAWNMIASVGVGMAVFEEDVSFAGHGHNSSVSEFIETRCVQHPERCDLAYLGEWNNFFTTHAIYIPPLTAHKLLELTSDCYPFGVQIDQGMHARCLHRPNRPKWNCVHPPAFHKHGGFGQGFFVQDPKAVPPTLHNRGSNRPIA